MVIQIFFLLLILLPQGNFDELIKKRYMRIESTDRKQWFDKSHTKISEMQFHESAQKFRRSGVTLIRMLDEIGV